MSGPPGTFPCPWCGLTYPARPVLVGKVVRCKGCSNAFILQADGNALKAAPEAIPASSGDTPPPARTTTPLASPTQTPSARLKTPRPTTERSQRAKSEHLEAARAKMAADLAAVATKAADSEVAKREERRSERLTKVGATGKAAEDAKRSQHTAVLTGEGERHHRQALLWAFGALAVVGVLALIVVAFTVRSAARTALDVYTGAVPDASVRYPEMGDIIKARAWLTSSLSQGSGPQVATDLSDAVFGAERSIDLAALATRFAELKCLRFDSKLGWWVEPGERSRLRAIFANRPASEWQRLALTNHIQAIEHAAWLKRIDLPAEDRQVVADLIAGQSSPEGIHFASRLLDSGDVPERIHLRSFSGKRGEMRIDVGPPRYLLKILPYRGTLARFEGVGWSTEWRVLDLHVVR